MRITEKCDYRIMLMTNQLCLLTISFHVDIIIVSYGQQ